MTKIKKGSILVFTLIIMSLILVTALTLSTTMIIERKASTITRSSAAAIQGADSGLEFVLREFRANYESSQVYDEFITGLISNPPALATSTYCDDNSSGHENTGDFVIELSNPKQKIRIIAIAKDSSGVDMPPVRCDDSTSATTPLTSGITLQDIVAFKSIGEDRITKRALRIDMGSSIDRGMVAFWDFEDYENASDSTGEEGPILVVSDMSKGGNEAYLCPDSEQSSSECDSSSGDDMNPGPDPSVADYNKEISWYGGFGASPTKTGIATHDLDIMNHWAMEFNIGASHDGTGTFPNEYLLVEDPDAFGFLNRENFSISMWVRPEDLTGEQDLLRKGTDTNDKKYVIKIIGNQIQFTVQSNSTRKVQFLSSSSISENDWHHVLMTVERYGTNNKSAEATGYINGSSVGSGSHSNMWGINDNGKNLIMGSNDNRDGRFFKGQLDDIRIYDRVVSQEEISQLCMKGTGFTTSNCNAP